MKFWIGSNSKAFQDYEEVARRDLTYTFLKHLVTLTRVGFCFVIKGENPSWSYGNTFMWAEVYPDCRGENQSPINIEPKEAKRKQLPKFTFHNYDKIKRIKASNNGHTGC